MSDIDLVALVFGNNDDQRELAGFVLREIASEAKINLKVDNAGSEGGFVSCLNNRRYDIIVGNVEDLPKETLANKGSRYVRFPERTTTTQDHFALKTRIEESLYGDMRVPTETQTQSLY